jgi:hypothetical protein
MYNAQDIKNGYDTLSSKDSEIKMSFLSFMLHHDLITIMEGWGRRRTAYFHRCIC